MTFAPLSSQPTECWSALAAAVVALTVDPFEDPRFDEEDDHWRPEPDFDEEDEAEEPTPVERPRSAKGAA